MPIQAIEATSNQSTESKTAKSELKNDHLIHGTNLHMLNLSYFS